MSVIKHRLLEDINAEQLTPGNVDKMIITGGTIQTSHDSATGVKMTSTGINFYDNVASFLLGSTSYGSIFASAVEGLKIQGNVDVTIKAGSGSVLIKSATDIQGALQCDSLRVDQTPTATPPTASHYITINCNGTLYRMCLDEN